MYDLMAPGANKEPLSPTADLELFGRHKTSFDDKEEEFKAQSLPFEPSIL